MPNTPNLNIPYPSDADTVDVPRDLQALALAVDAFNADRTYYSAVDTEESRTNAAYGPMATPDQLVVPIPTTDHILEVMCWGEIKETVANAANVQLDAGGQFSRDLGLNAVSPPVPVGTYGLFFSGGLDYYGVGANLKFLTAAGGVVFPSVFRIKFAAPGDKTISLFYRASSGTITARNRRIRAKVLLPLAG